MLFASVICLLTHYILAEKFSAEYNLGKHSTQLKVRKKKENWDSPPSRYNKRQNMCCAFKYAFDIGCHYDVEFGNVSQWYFCLCSIVLSDNLPIDISFPTDPYVMSAPFLLRHVILWITMFLARCKYYFGWISCKWSNIKFHSLVHIGQLVTSRRDVVCLHKIFWVMVGWICDRFQTPKLGEYWQLLIIN